VLGYPIHHSRSPIVQNVIAIPILEKDFETATHFLKELGLDHAAVTSPLKSAAGKLCDANTDFNSLALKNNKWLGCSTDQLGFKKILESVPNHLKNEIAVWGGGGVISALATELPNAAYYSARTGLIKSGGPTFNPKVLIWAAPRTHEVKFPYEIYPDWTPEIIIDLNYTENSMGIECAKDYAKKNNCKYISGLEMFLEQAHHQRIFWKEST
jgi:shikimate 5-dehydrogenase